MKFIVTCLILIIPLFAFSNSGISSKLSSQKYTKAKFFFSKNNYDSASLVLFQIISQTTKRDSFNVKAHVLLGYIFSLTEKYDLSKKYLLNALDNCENEKIRGQIYGNLGELHFKLNKPKIALDYFLKTVPLQKSKNNQDYQNTLSNIGAAYIKLKNLNKALPYVKKANEIAIKINDKVGQSICTNNLATIYRDLNQTDSALYYYKMALYMVDELASKEEKKTILYNLSELYEKKGNPFEALTYYKKYTLLKDELFNTEKNEFIVETQEKYQATERQKDLAEMKLKIQKEDAKHKQSIFTFVLVSIISLIVFISILAWLRWKSIQQKNKAKFEIITATMQGEEKQRLKISQELHDDLGGILGMCRMLFTKGKQYFIDQNKELFDRIDSLLIQANNRSRAISHDLFSPTLKQFGLFPAIQELIADMQLSNPDLEIRFVMDDFRLNEQLELNCFRITQELLTNTIKYANASSINLEIKIILNTLQYDYTDNGVGFDLSSIKKGVGLNSIEARVKSFDGKINYIRSTNGFGAKISFKNFKKM